MARLVNPLEKRRPTRSRSRVESWASGAAKTAALFAFQGGLLRAGVRGRLAREILPGDELAQVLPALPVDEGMAGNRKQPGGKGGAGGVIVRQAAQQAFEHLHGEIAGSGGIITTVLEVGENSGCVLFVQGREGLRILTGLPGFVLIRFCHAVQYSPDR